MKLDTSDMPKLHSPFIREKINGKYVCTPKIDPDYRWVFEKSMAVDKLDGTNVAVWIKDGKPDKITNRKNEIDMWTKNGYRFMQGILASMKKEYFYPHKCKNGTYYGELIGKTFQGNPYEIDTHLWIPFEYMKIKYEYKFWQGVLSEIKNKSDEEIYNAISDIFKNLWSLYKRQKGLGKKYDIRDIDENMGFKEMAAEGIVFYSKDGKMAKLRRDMFDWYTPAFHG